MSEHDSHKQLAAKSKIPPDRSGWPDWVLIPRPKKMGKVFEKLVAEGEDRCVRRAASLKKQIRAVEDRVEGVKDKPTIPGTSSNRCLILGIPCFLQRLGIPPVQNWTNCVNGLPSLKGTDGRKGQT